MCICVKLSPMQVQTDIIGNQQMQSPIQEAQRNMYTPEYQPNGSEVAVITTDKGVIKVQLHGQDAPIHVGNFVELAQKGFYDGLKFHRYVPDFVIQGGCPNTRDMSQEDVAAGKMGPSGMPGTGGPGYTIKHEYDTNPNNEHKDGTLAMARSQMPDSAGSQFYLCLGPQPFLDSGYTVFGDTIEGLDVVHSLRQGDLIESIVIEGAN
jgi:peptidyl-prolyl cis-trans isomerase B (cyclophilin B)